MPSYTDDATETLAHEIFLRMCSNLEKESYRDWVIMKGPSESFRIAKAFMKEQEKQKRLRDNYSEW